MTRNPYKLAYDTKPQQYLDEAVSSGSVKSQVRLVDESPPRRAVLLKLLKIASGRETPIFPPERSLPLFQLATQMVAVAFTC